MKRLKLSIISDSVGMPRVTESETILYESSWPNLLNYELLNSLNGRQIVTAYFGQRSRSIKSIKSAIQEAISFVQPEYCIVQVGIVDCAPRIFSELESKIINMRFVPKKMRDIIIKLRNRRRKYITASNPLRKVYTQPDPFAQLLHDFIIESKRAWPGVKIILVPIFGNYNVLELKSPGFRSNIQMYNDILLNEADNKTIIFLSNLVEAIGINCFCEDGYHLSSVGHATMASNLKNWIIKDLSTYQ